MNTYKIKIAVIAWLVVLLSSCNKILEDTNVNNNNPSDIPLSGLLPSAEVALTYSLAANFSIRSSVFVQHISGIGGFAVNEDKYDFSTTSFDGAWSDTYTRALNNLAQITKKAEASQSPAYAGISKVLTAISLGLLTDSYGNIPYTEALDPTILAPAYEEQETIYVAIQRLLDEAITDLNKTSSFLPGNDDLLFKGNLARWTAVAWTLKARYALHLSRIDARTSATKALEYLYDGVTYRGISNNDGDMAIAFGTSNNQASPWFTQDAGRPGWYGMGGFLVDLLNGTPPTVPVDPRRAALAAPRPAPAAPNTFIGARPGVPAAASNIVGSNTYYGRNNSPVSIISFPEAKFIEAEARLILNENDPLIKTALELGVRNSFAKLTSATDPFATKDRQDEYIDKRVQLKGTAEQKKELILTQKYIALYLNPEAWVDYRRTGYPVLTPANGGATAINPNGKIPRRFAYPNTEKNLNPKLPVKDSDLQSPKLWWDK